LQTPQTCDTKLPENHGKTACQELP
jgi:hypothetical protein